MTKQEEIRVWYKREWYCKTEGTRCGEFVLEKPLLSRTDTCPECAIKRDEAQWQLEKR